MSAIFFTASSNPVTISTQSNMAMPTRPKDAALLVIERFFLQETTLHAKDCLEVR